MAKVFETFDQFLAFWQANPFVRLSNFGRTVVTSGGFDPLHTGHVRCIRGSGRLGSRLIVIVNGDGFLERKKGYVFMPLAERMEIIAALDGVDFVVPFDDGSQYVTHALRLIQPDVFAKGGDRSDVSQLVQEEVDICNKIGCKIELGVGGRDKIQSSSELVKKAGNANSHA